MCDDRVRSGQGLQPLLKIKSHFTDNEFLNNYIMDRYDGMCKHQKGFHWLEPGLYLETQR